MAAVDTTKKYFNALTITNGQVIVNGTKSNTSVVTDSIYFELQVDDPTKLGLAAGTKLIVSGKRRTGFFYKLRIIIIIFRVTELYLLHFIQIISIPLR